MIKTAFSLTVGIPEDFCDLRPFFSLFKCVETSEAIIF